jgi:rhodanese-related sulfurtransferase
MPQQCDWDISVEDLKGLQDESADFVLIDVREENEFAACEIGGQLVPVGTLPDRLGDFDKSAHIVVHCKSGGRSAHAVKLMRASGFENAWNVQGGLLAWIARIDSSLSL